MAAGETTVEMRRTTKQWWRVIVLVPVLVALSRYAVAQHGNPVLQAEHEAVMGLIPDSSVTHTAVISGAWTEPATWGGAVPGAGAVVLVPDDIAVAFDATETPDIHGLRVDGTLAFVTTHSTRLSVGTIVVTHHGTLTVGTVASPIPQGETATIEFTDLGEIDRTSDPGLFSRGLISHGAVEMCGQPATSHVRLTAGAPAGSTTLYLSHAPTGWHAGDTVLIAGVNPDAAEDERAEIASVNGEAITLTHPLAFSHVGHSGKQPHVAHLTRNVVLRSESPAIGRRGHTMFMHSDAVRIFGVAFVDLGRTDKSKPFSATNVTGRYSVHIHRAGHASAVTIGDCVVDGNPGWGIVNHSSSVLVTDCVTAFVTGSGFSSEAGDEIGSFERCIAIRTTGAGLAPNGTIDGRFSTQDFGFEGHGYWLQGNAVRVVDCVAAGHPAFGFAFNSFGLTQPGLGQTKFPTASLPDPSIFPGKSEVPVDVVPLTEVRSIEAYACRQGYLAWRFNQQASAPLVSVVDGLVTWNCSLVGLNFGYQTGGEYRDCELLGSGSGYGIRGNKPYGKQLTFRDCTITGWSTGLLCPQSSTTTVVDCAFDGNGLDVDFTRIQTVITIGRVLHLSDAPVTVRLGPGPQPLTPQDYGPDSYFQREQITIGDRQLYWREQAPDHVLFPANTPFTWVPWSLRKRTNQQLLDEYGVCFLGAIAPMDSVPFADGIIGAPAGTYQEPITLQSAKFTPQLDGDYLLRYAIGGKQTRETTGTQLVAGWNVVTREIGGKPRSMFVYGDRIPPVFTPTSKLEVLRANLTKPFTITGWLDDDLRGRSKTAVSVDLRPLQVQTDFMGYAFVEPIVTFKDLAGNGAKQKFQVFVR